MKHFTTIYAVTPSYEPPIAYFSTLEAASEYRDSLVALYAAWLAWVDSPEAETDNFVAPEGMEDEPILAGECFIDEIRVY